MAPRADASTFPHVAVADGYADRAVSAFEELLGALRAGFSGRQAASLVGAASPAFTAGVVAPEVQVAKAVTEASLAELFAEIATEAGTGRAGFTASFTQVRDESVAFAREQAAELVTGINAQTKGLIASVITRGQAGDLTWNQMAAEIRPLIGLTPADAQAALNYRAALQKRVLDQRYGKGSAATLGRQFTLSPWQGGKLDGRVDDLYQQYVGRLLRERAVTIARTETIKAASAGEMISWQATIDDGGADGYMVTREWSTTRDDRACRACMALDGEKRTTAPIGEGARPSLAADGGFGGVPHPPLHPRCRCVILTTMDLAPVPERPERPTEPEWKTAAKKQQVAVGRAAARARKFGGDTGPESMKAARAMETSVRKLGKQLDDEIRARLVADGVEIVDATAYRKAKAAFEKAEAATLKRWDAIEAMERKKRGDGRPLNERILSRTHNDRQYIELRAKRDRLRIEMREARDGAQRFRRAHAAKVSEVLGEVRKMGGTIDIGDVYSGKKAIARGVDIEAGMAEVAKRYPATWVERSSALGPVNIKYEARRAYYHHAIESVALTPDQLRDLAGNSTVTHEFMHRMEYANPDVMRAEWAFVNRRGGKEGPSKLSDLTGNAGYAPHEIAVGDEFSNPYMGKIYNNRPDEAWEAMTMGVEGLYWSDRPGLDTDYTHFVLGVLAGL